MCHHPTWNSVWGVNGVSSQTLNFFMLSVIYPHGPFMKHEYIECIPKTVIRTIQKLSGTLDRGLNTKPAEELPLPSFLHLIQNSILS